MSAPPQGAKHSIRRTCHTVVLGPKLASEAERRTSKRFVTLFTRLANSNEGYVAVRSMGSIEIYALPALGAKGCGREYGGRQ